MINRTRAVYGWDNSEGNFKYYIINIFNKIDLRQDFLWKYLCIIYTVFYTIKNCINSNFSSWFSHDHIDHMKSHIDFFYKKSLNTLYKFTVSLLKI